MTKADDEANEKYNEKVKTTGTWIDKKFLEEVIGSSIEKEVKVLDYEIKPAVGAGDNYLSILYRTPVRYISNGSDEEEDTQLMIKGAPTAQFILEFIEEMGVFNKEITMYNKCLPAFHKYLKEFFPKGTPYIAPNSYKCQRENTLVMEDLAKQGYKMANRRNQLDFQHCVATLQTVARFHALSVKIQQEDPELIKSVSKEFYAESNREKMAPFLVEGLNMVAAAHEKVEENARFGKTLREISKFIWEKVLKIVQPSKKFNVLNHGDLWVNNMLFKYNEDGSVLNAKLVDFQLSRYSTPALDLHYFLFTSPQAAVLKEKMTELLHIYHTTLTESLEALGMDVNYSFEDLEEDMREKAAFGVLAVAQILPIIIAAPSENLNLDELKLEDITSGEDNPMKNNFENPFYINVSGQFLSHLESIGYLSEAVSRFQSFVDELEAKEAKINGEKS